MSRIAARLEDIMLYNGIYSRYSFARRLLGYGSISPNTAVYRALAGREITHMKLCDIAERTGSIPLLFFKRKTGKPIFGPGGTEKFVKPIDYDYFKHYYVGAVLKDRRQSHKLEFGQAELAANVGMPRQTICEIEHGGYSPPVPQTLDKVCDALGLDTEFFVTPLGITPAQPERKPARQCIQELIDPNGQINTMEALSRAVGPRTILRYTLHEADINGKFLYRICASPSIKNIFGQRLPFVIWYHSKRTNSWQVDTLGSDMLASGNMPDKYAQRVISRHRTLRQISRMQFLRSVAQNDYKWPKITNNVFTIQKLEVLLGYLNLIPQYLVKTLKVS